MNFENCVSVTEREAVENLKNYQRWKIQKLFFFTLEFKLSTTAFQL